MSEAWTDPDYDVFALSDEGGYDVRENGCDLEVDWNFDPSDFDLNRLIPLWDERDKTELIPL